MAKSVITAMSTAYRVCALCVRQQTVSAVPLMLVPCPAVGLMLFYF